MQSDFDYYGIQDRNQERTENQWSDRRSASRMLSTDSLQRGFQTVKSWVTNTAGTRGTSPGSVVRIIKPLPWYRAFRSKSGNSKLLKDVLEITFIFWFFCCVLVSLEASSRVRTFATKIFFWEKQWEIVSRYVTDSIKISDQNLSNFTYFEIKQFLTTFLGTQAK